MLISGRLFFFQNEDLTVIKFPLEIEFSLFLSAITCRRYRMTTIPLVTRNDPCLRHSWTTSVRPPILISPEWSSSPISLSSIAIMIPAIIPGRVSRRKKRFVFFLTMKTTFFFNVKVLPSDKLFSLHLLFLSSLLSVSLFVEALTFTVLNSE